jgi:hypothetical protein
LEYTASAGQIQRWFAYGRGPDEVLNQMNVVTGTRATFIPDIQGSVLATLDSGSGALTKAAYLPYGENANTTTGTFRFTGRRLDSETAGSAAEPSGLHYYRARMYSPTLGSKLNYTLTRLHRVRFDASARWERDNVEPFLAIR